MDNFVTVRISENTLKKLKPILSKYTAEKLKEAVRHMEHAEKTESGEMKTDIDAATYRRWASEDAQEADVVFTTMRALYGED